MLSCDVCLLDCNIFSLIHRFSTVFLVLFYLMLFWRIFYLFFFCFVADGRKNKVSRKTTSKKKDKIAQHQFDEAEAEHSRGQAELPAACRRPAGQPDVSDPLALAVLCCPGRCNLAEFLKSNSISSSSKQRNKINSQIKHMKMPKFFSIVSIWRN